MTLSKDAFLCFILMVNFIPPLGSFFLTKLLKRTLLFVPSFLFRFLILGSSSLFLVLGSLFLVLGSLFLILGSQFSVSCF